MRIGFSLVQKDRSLIGVYQSVLFIKAYEENSNNIEDLNIVEQIKSTDSHIFIRKNVWIIQKEIRNRKASIKI